MGNELFSELAFFDIRPFCVRKNVDNLQLIKCAGWLPSGNALDLEEWLFTVKAWSPGLKSAERSEYGGVCMRPPTRLLVEFGNGSHEYYGFKGHTRAKTPYEKDNAFILNLDVWRAA